MHCDTDKIINDLKEESRKSKGTWSYETISSLTKRSKELKDNDTVRVLQEIIQDMVSQDTPLAARFKYAQLCSQLYFSNFPNFQEVFVASKGAIDAYCGCCANSPLEQASKSYLTQIYDQIPSLQTGPSPRQAMRWMKIASTGPAPGKSTKFAIPQNPFFPLNQNENINTLNTPAQLSLSPSSSLSESSKSAKVVKQNKSLSGKIKEEKFNHRFTQYKLAEYKPASVTSSRSSIHTFGKSSESELSVKSDPHMHYERKGSYPIINNKNFNMNNNNNINRNENYLVKFDLPPFSSGEGSRVSGVYGRSMSIPTLRKSKSSEKVSILHQKLGEHKPELRELHAKDVSPPPTLLVLDGMLEGKTNDKKHSMYEPRDAGVQFGPSPREIRSPTSSRSPSPGTLVVKNQKEITIQISDSQKIQKATINSNSKSENQDAKRERWLPLGIKMPGEFSPPAPGPLIARSDAASNQQESHSEAIPSLFNKEGGTVIPRVLGIPKVLDVPEGYRLPEAVAGASQAARSSPSGPSAIGAPTEAAPTTPPEPSDTGGPSSSSRVPPGLKMPDGTTSGVAAGLKLPEGAENHLSGRSCPTIPAGLKMPDGTISAAPPARERGSADGVAPSPADCLQRRPGPISFASAPKAEQSTPRAPGGTALAGGSPIPPGLKMPDGTISGGLSPFAQKPAAAAPRMPEGKAPPDSGAKIPAGSADPSGIVKHKAANLPRPSSAISAVPPSSVDAPSSLARCPSPPLTAAIPPGLKMPDGSISGGLSPWSASEGSSSIPPGLKMPGPASEALPPFRPIPQCRRVSEAAPGSRERSARFGGPGAECKPVKATDLSPKPRQRPNKPSPIEIAASPGEDLNVRIIKAGDSERNKSQDSSVRSASDGVFDFPGSYTPAPKIQYTASLFNPRMSVPIGLANDDERLTPRTPHGLDVKDLVKLKSRLRQTFSHGGSPTTEKASTRFTHSPMYLSDSSTGSESVYKK